MTLAIKHIHNLPPYLSCVSTLPDITQKVKNMSLTGWSRASLTLGTAFFRALTKPVANRAACMCKGKGTSLQTPTVI